MWFGWKIQTEIAHPMWPLFIHRCCPHKSGTFRYVHKISFCHLSYYERALFHNLSLSEFKGLQIRVSNGDNPTSWR